MTQRYPAVSLATEATHCVNTVGRRARESVARHSDTSVTRNAGRKGQGLYKENKINSAVQDEGGKTTRGHTYEFFLSVWRSFLLVARRDSHNSILRP